MSINRKRTTKIVLIMLLVLGFFAISNFSFAEITQKDNPYLNSADNKWADFTGTVAFVLSIGAGALAWPVTALVNVIILAIFSVIWLIFSPMTGGVFPFPDQIVFNKVPFLDPNVFNPPSGVDFSPAGALQSVVMDLYQTGFVVATTVFGIAALVIGIKLAISTIASEKAHYKQALNNWILGIVLLFTTHFIMAGILALNEEIVALVSDQVNSIVFEMDITELVPTYIPGAKALAKAASSVIKVLAPGTASALTINFEGYGGLVMMFLLKATIGFDLVSAIICGIMLGQVIALIAMYVKRFFYVIILIIIAPLIIAFDVIKKTV